MAESAIPDNPAPGGGRSVTATEAHPLAWKLARREALWRWAKSHPQPWRCSLPCVLGGVADPADPSLVVVEGGVAHPECVWAAYQAQRGVAASGARATNSLRVPCPAPGCQLVTTPGALSSHRKATGH